MSFHTNRRAPQFKDLEELRTIYLAQKNLGSKESRARQERGYFLERALYAVLYWEGMPVSPSFKTDLDQVDGAFFLDRRTFLLEAKWTREPIGENDLTIFKALVDSRLNGTIGVFISMGGYAETAFVRFRHKEPVNVVCFDQSDVDAVIEYGHKFLDVLDFKLRQAGEHGQLYVPIELPARVNEAEGKATKVSGPYEYVPLLDSVQETPSEYRVQRRSRVYVFCEGRTDIAILSEVVRRLTAEGDAFTNTDLQFFSGDGKQGLLRHLPAVVGLLEESDGVVVIVDSDGDSDSLQAAYRSRVLENLRSVLDVAPRLAVEVLFAQPYLEVALGLPPKGVRANAGADVKQAVKQLDLASVQSSDLVQQLISFVDSLATANAPESLARASVRMALRGAEWRSDSVLVAWGNTVGCRSLEQLRVTLLGIANGGESVGRGADAQDYAYLVGQELTWYQNELRCLGWVP